MKIIIHWLKKWTLWVPILCSLIALFISIWSNMISREANRIASQNNELTKKIEKLDFRPILRIHSLFKTIGKLPPHFTITNVGSIEAQQIKIKMYGHRFFAKTNNINISGTNSTNDIYIKKLLTQETKAFEFREGWLNKNARLAQLPQHNIMEIKITYRRPQDLTEYDESSFYFVNPDGLWVSEKSSSLNTDFYKKIKEILFQRISDENNMIYWEWRGDLLHTNR